MKKQLNIPDNSDQLYDQTFILVTTFLQQCHQYPYDQNAILSFHRGSWYQQHTGVWHCHLCVPLAPYRQEATGKFDSKYMTTLDGYKTKTKGKYDGYRNSTVNSARHETPITVQLPASPDFELVWMSNEPRLGIRQKGSSRTIRHLYDFLRTTENALQNRIPNYGSHFCLFVSGASGTNTVTRAAPVLDAAGSASNSQIVGYIQLGSTDYYRILPDPLKAIWLQAFRNNTSYTVET